MEQLESGLVKRRWITQEQLNRARFEADRSKQSLWLALVRLGILSEEAIAIYFAQESGIPYVRVSDYAVDRETLSLIDEHFSRQNRVLPLCRVDNILYVACANPLDTALVDSLAKMSGCMIEPLVAESHAILAQLDTYWHPDEGAFAMGDLIIKQESLAGVSLWRQAERLPFDVFYNLRPVSRDVLLASFLPVCGKACDISQDAQAAGVRSNHYLPKGLFVIFEFSEEEVVDIDGSAICVKAEIVHSRMESPGVYFLGARFVDVDQEKKEKLLRMVKNKNA